MSRFFLTTAIDYVNSRPHLGTAYEKIAADVIARYKRLAGYDVRFVMGNDEHSQNVFRKAREAGLDPLAYCDQMETQFREVWGQLNISFDDFIRTTEPRHRRAVETIVRRSFEAGDIYEGEYEGWYCVSCEAFKQEKDLVEGLCPIHQRRPDWIKERNYFFRLSGYRDRLLAHYAQHPTFIEPESRRNEMLRLVEAGLEDISVSRAGQAWGIPLPFDPSSVVYVWYDALINYIAAIGYGTDQELFETWWPADLHLVGKDITRFHCVIWPAMLMSAGLALPEAGLRTRLGAHQGAADEQVARERPGSARRGRAARAGSAPSVPRQGNRVWTGRRLHLGPLRREVQRRPGEQPGQPGQSRDRHGRAVPAGPARAFVGQRSAA